MAGGFGAKIIGTTRGTTFSRTRLAITPSARHTRERLIRRGDQAPRERDTFRLVALQKRGVCAPLENGRELPGQVGCASDAGVHTLPTHGTVDMRGVSKEECATRAEPIGTGLTHSTRSRSLGGQSIRFT